MSLKYRIEVDLEMADPASVYPGMFTSQISAKLKELHGHGSYTIHRVALIPQHFVDLELEKRECADSALIDIQNATSLEEAKRIAANGFAGSR